MPPLILADAQAFAYARLCPDAAAQTAKRGYVKTC
jgi:hypothetical protein